MTSTLAVIPEAHTLPRYVHRIDSPLGRIELTSDDSAITSLKIEGGASGAFDDEFASSADALPPVILAAAQQLDEYFAGTRQEFDVPVRLEGTEFQRAVWAQLQALRWGDVVSYGELGLSTGRATAGRAVGGAVGANPVPIIVACHRVLASDGRITGYSAGQGVPTKVWLLDHEHIQHK